MQEIIFLTENNKLFENEVNEKLAAKYPDISKAFNQISDITKRSLEVCDITTESLAISYLEDKNTEELVSRLDKTTEAVLNNDNKEAIINDYIEHNLLELSTTDLDETVKVMSDRFEEKEKQFKENFKYVTEEEYTVIKSETIENQKKRTSAQVSRKCNLLNNLIKKHSM